MGSQASEQSVLQSDEIIRQPSYDLMNSSDPV